MPAVVMVGGGEQVTFAELDRASNRGAQLLRQHGLKRGDIFALWSTNNARYFEIVWAMQRSGLYMVPIASKLKAGEVEYIVNSCGAQVVIIDATVGEAAEIFAREHTARCTGVKQFYSLRDALSGLLRWEGAIAEMPAAPIPDQSTGRVLIYSSGTTGLPKGVQQPLFTEAFDEMDSYANFHRDLFKTEPGTPFLATAPLYHSGTILPSMIEQRLGATIVTFEKFDAETALAIIEKYRISRGQFVPTMFTRMLKLPDATRAKYDVSSLRVVVHSAGPCPPEVKRGIIDWWGPILLDMYGGTENIGLTLIDSHEWLKKPGSVGRAVMGKIHICSEEGNELPAGEQGVIYFEAGGDFAYLNDLEKTQESLHPKHSDWKTYGDIGWIDEDGYLFLSDRRAFMIVCGGVNIYPQEAENLLWMHPAVADAAVFGIPDPDLGEQVKAVVQPADWSKAGPELGAELIAYCRASLASLKCPKSIDFAKTLPRDAMGKMMKKQLRASYWSGSKKEAR